MEKARIISIHIFQWAFLIKELEKRGQGKRESGAVLLGKMGSTKITKFICLDELDKDCYINGMIKFHSVGYRKLWKYCEDNELGVIADVHTHPYSWTGQSVIDVNNPFVSIKGHIAIIVPYYAQKYFQRKAHASLYEYLGSYKWKPLNHKQLKFSLL